MWPRIHKIPQPRTLSIFTSKKLPQRDFKVFTSKRELWLLRDLGTIWLYSALLSTPGLRIWFRQSDSNKSHDPLRINTSSRRWLAPTSDNPQLQKCAATELHANLIRESIGTFWVLHWFPPTTMLSWVHHLGWSWCPYFRPLFGAPELFPIGKMLPGFKVIKIHVKFARITSGRSLFWHTSKKLHIHQL